MQTTLLGIAVVIILALVTALVGPLFVDWNRYRGEFEAQASRLTGLSVRIDGPIEARLLPTPTLTLQKVDLSRPGDASAVHADKLGVEFALGALVRGEWRANDVRVEGAEFSLGLDADGKLDWPAPKIGVDPDAISIQRLDIVDSRALLFANAAAGSGMVLEKFEFRGELRSLFGPVKGQGAFVLNGQHYPFRIAVSRPSEDGGARVRINFDPINLPRIAEADVTLTIEDGVPHYAGTLQLARAVGRAAKGTGDLIVEPWRISSKIKGDSRSALLEQIELQYGPDDRALKLKGDARLTFGNAPLLDGVLTSTQIDLDRMLSLPEAARRHPFEAVKALTDAIAGSHSVPVPVRLRIGIEQVTFAGAVLQRVALDVKGQTDDWDIEKLDFHGPGAAQVSLSGRLGVAENGITFVGPARVEALDPRAFVSWLTDRTDTQAPTTGTLHAGGDIDLKSGSFAIDHLQANLGRIALQGRLAYAWGNGDHPPRIEARLSAPELDLDRAQALVHGLFGENAFQWPREGALSVKVGRASLGGVDATGADVQMRFNGDGLDIERLTVADLAGARLDVKGHIDTRTKSPRGSMELMLDARALDGVTMLVEKAAPALADELRRKAAALVPAKLHATLTVNSQPSAANTPNTAAFRFDGSVGGFKVDLKGNAGGGPEAFAVANLGKLATTTLALTGQVDAGDGSALVDLLGLDRVVLADKGAGRLNFTASGSVDGEMAVDGALTAGKLAVSTKGSLRLRGNDGPTAVLDLKVAGANLRAPGSAPNTASGRPALPAAWTTKLTLAEGAVALKDLKGKIGGTDIAGQVRIGLAQPTSLQGDIQVASVALPATVAAIIGVPAKTTGSASAVWPSDPFEAGVVGNAVGALKLRLAQVALTPKLVAQDVRGVLNFDPSTVSFNEIDGALAGGRVTGELAFERGPDGVTTHSHLRLAGANAGELMPGEGKSALSGHLTLAVDLDGSGRSPVALVGALKGGGTFTLQDGRVTGLSASAFDAIIHKVDLGLPIDLVKIRGGMESALATGALVVPLAEGEIALAAGQARVSNVAVRAENADLRVSGGIDLAQNTIDARLLMQGPAGLGGASSGRPELAILLKGPLAAPQRMLDVVALTNWLSLRQIEQQTKRIESLESGRELPAKPPEPQKPASAEPSPAPAPSSGATLEKPESKPDATPAATPPAKPPAVAPREVRTTPAARAKPRRTAPAPSSPQPAPAPSFSRSLRELFGLSPPMDIRPPSASR